MEERHREAAERIRAQIQRGEHDTGQFRAALLSVPPGVRDDWLDCVFELDGLPDDGPALPRGCVPYIPCSVEVLLRAVELAPVEYDDVFVDIGSGLARAAVFVHLLTGAGAMGLEIQPGLVCAARELAARMGASRVSCVEGDAAKQTGLLAMGSVFFLYCPFGGDRLTTVLADLEAVASTRAIRVCCVHLPLPPCPWLVRDPHPATDLVIYRSAARGP